MSDDVPVDPYDATEILARALDRHVDYRVLRRMRPMHRNGGGVGAGALAGCALDLRTTGPDVRDHAVVELALQRFWADSGGRIVTTGVPHRWLEDPGGDLDRIAAVMGLNEGEIAGRCIPDGIAASLIVDAHFVVAHDAARKRPFVEARLPGTVGACWVCTATEIDWERHGFTARGLSHLVMEAGWFRDRHDGADDLTALLHLLEHPLPHDGTVLTEAVRAASRPTWRIDLAGAPFGAGYMVDARGYRWAAAARVWSREVPIDGMEAETDWATMEVYGGMARPRTRRITWRERHTLH